MSDNKENQLFYGRVDKIVPKGLGIIRSEQGVVFLPQVLAGEEVKYRITEKKKKFQRGELLELITPSQHRVAPDCKYYGECGGCDFQHIAADTQSEYKVSMIMEAGERSKLDLRSTFSSNISLKKSYYYRNRVQFQTDGTRLGFYKRSTNEIIEINQCKTASKEINYYLQSIRRSMTDQKDQEVKRKIILGMEGKIAESESQRSLISVSILGKNFEISADGFFQSSLEATEIIGLWLRDCLAKLSSQSQGESFSEKNLQATNEKKKFHLLEAYCGAAILSGLIEEYLDSVTAIDIDASNTELARKNLQGMESWVFTSSMEKWVNRNTKVSKANEEGSVSMKDGKKLLNHRGDEINLILLDPPRKGLDTMVCSFLISYYFEYCLLISCDPITAIRDIKRIEQCYEVQYWSHLDIYPQTSHMEMAVLLKRKVENK